MTTIPDKSYREALEERAVDLCVREALTITWAGVRLGLIRVVGRTDAGNPIFEMTRKWHEAGTEASLAAIQEWREGNGDDSTV